MDEENRLKNLAKLTQDGSLSLIKKELCDNKDIRNAICTKHFGKSGDTLLHYAARHGHLSVMAYLVEELGMDTELYNNDYKRALHEAASMSRVECVHYLLNNGAKVDCLKKADWTPLMMACTRRDVDVIETLLKHGANPALKNKDGWNCFHIACREGDPAVVQRLLVASSGIWDTQSNILRTPLHTAAMHGCEDVVNFLLNNCGYQPDSRDSCGVTPFTDAVRNGHLGIARLLLEKHRVRRRQRRLSEASPTAADCMGAQPLHHASITAQEGALRFLVEDLGVCVNVRATEMELTALHYAAKEGHANAVRTLCALGANLQARDKKGRTALHLASVGQHASAVRVLLQLGLGDTEDTSRTKASQLARKADVLHAFHSCDSQETGEIMPGVVTEERL